MKYPILLVHGMGFRDHKKLNYWGRIPAKLEELGCAVYYGNQDSNADAETNGRVLAARIGEILAESGAEKVNIIAHSKGGLDSRYVISSLQMAEKVASLTTVSTPHNGSKTVDLLLKAPDFLVRFGSACADLWFRLLGDQKPHTYRVIRSFTTAEAERFNRENPDVEGVYYQSYAFAMRHPFSDGLMWFPSTVVGWIEGENDGLLPPEAVRWTNFQGVYRGVGRRGISHLDEIDLRRRRFSKKGGEGVSDIVDFYRDVILDLEKQGF